MFLSIRRAAAAASCAFALLFGAGSASAAVVDLQVEGGAAGPQVYQLGNGNFLGLWGFNNRDRDAVTIFDRDELIGGFTSGGGNIVEFYDASFSVQTFPIDIAAGARLFDALWIEWTGGNLVYNFQGGTRSMGDGVTLAGDPLSAIPLPAPAFLLMAGLGGLAVAARRRRTKQALA